MAGGQNLCYCVTCAKEIRSLGIARHRAMHRDKKEDCIISYSNGFTYRHNFGFDSKAGAK